MYNVVCRVQSLSKKFEIYFRGDTVALLGVVDRWKKNLEGGLLPRLNWMHSLCTASTARGQKYNIFSERISSSEYGVIIMQCLQ